VLATHLPVKTAESEPPLQKMQRSRLRLTPGTPPLSHFQDKYECRALSGLPRAMAE